MPERKNGANLKSGESLFDGGAHSAHIGTACRFGLDLAHDLAHVPHALGATRGDRLVNEGGEFVSRQLFRQVLLEYLDFRTLDGGEARFSYHGLLFNCTTYSWAGADFAGIDVPQFGPVNSPSITRAWAEGEGQSQTGAIITRNPDD